MTDTLETRIMLVDDHPLVRRGLTELISDEDDLTVCEQVPSAEEALHVFGEAKPDLVIVDISLPGMSGLELIKRLRTRDPSIKILVSSMHEESLFAERALRGGANGYVNKEEATENVVDAIRKILNGEVYLSEEMTQKMVSGVISGEATKSVVETLTDREFEIFRFIGSGLTARDISEKLHLSIKTVESHRDHIRHKLNLANSNELVCYAVKWTLECKQNRPPV